jgi:hypothetical protein
MASAEVKVCDDTGCSRLMFDNKSALGLGLSMIARAGRFQKLQFLTGTRFKDSVYPPLFVICSMVLCLVSNITNVCKILLKSNCETTVFLLGLTIH